MYLAYNGVVFDLLLLENWDRVAEYSEDGTDFLHWRHDIVVTAIVNESVNWAGIEDELNESTNIKIKNDAKERIASYQGSKVIKNPSPSPYGYGNQKPLWQQEEGNKYSNIDAQNYAKAVSDAVNIMLQNIGYTQAGKPFSVRVNVPPLNNNEFVAWTNLMASWPMQFTGGIALTSSILTQFAAGGVGSINTNNTNELAVAPAAYVSSQVDGSGIPPALQTPGHKIGESVPITVHEIEARLCKPRKTLAIWINSSAAGGDPEYLLYLPYPGMATDSRHGPQCSILATPAIHGNVTGIMRLKFTCWDSPLVGVTPEQLVNLEGNPIPADSLIGVPSGATDVAAIGGLLAKTPPILSNRWKMSQQPDPNTHLNRTVIEGTVHFRMDVLQAKQVTADQLRAFIMPPIPFGYIRKPPTVQLSSDGSAVHYVVVDEQQMMDNPGGAYWGVHSVMVKEAYEGKTPLDITKPNITIESVREMNSTFFGEIGAEAIKQTGIMAGNAYRRFVEGKKGFSR